MTQKASQLSLANTITVIGSGVAGLCCAYTLLQQGHKVSIITASQGPDESCCSWWAGGMLAPYCEQKSVEPLIEILGFESMKFWQRFAKEHQLDYHANGSLVVAAPRDQSLLREFSNRTHSGDWLSSQQIAELEPDLAHFSRGLWFENEAHLEPRVMISALWQACESLGAEFKTGYELDQEQLQQQRSSCDWLIDCRGLRAANTNINTQDLRGVKGEMLYLYCPEVRLKRSIRLLHPRHPIYLVPRPDNVFMLGATMVEVNTSKHATVRSILELLSAAYAIHSAFAEAEIIEIGVNSRPAFNDNLPKLRVDQNAVTVNGLYRHGFLAAPALARRVSDFINYGQRCSEVFDDHHC